MEPSILNTVKRLTTFLIFISVSLVITSCRELDEFVPVLDSVTFDFSEEFSAKADTLSVSINGKNTTIITTPKGTEFVFKQDMFAFENGESCPCETVLIEIIEVDKKRDYLVHDVSTVSEDQILTSAGAYRLAAFYQGKSLRLAPGRQFYFSLPTEILDPEMELFYGERTGVSLDWAPAARSSGSQVSVIPGEWQYNDTSSLIVGYQVFSDRMEWLTIGKFASESAANPVCIKLDESYNSDNTILFALFQKEKSILKLNSQANKGFCSVNIPVGTEIIFIAIHKKGNNLYQFASEYTTIRENHFQSLDFTQMTFDQIKVHLLNL